MYCRILGYLFHHFPAPEVNDNFVLEIKSSAFEEEKLLDLGKHFYEHFIKMWAHTDTLVASVLAIV